jgi:hypothetical protein
MAHSARVLKVLQETATFTSVEKAELAEELKRPTLLPARDLIALFSRVPKDAAFADDLERVIRERESPDDESGTSPWDR